jgi:Ca2+-transporting ATPase
MTGDGVNDAPRWLARMWHCYMGRRGTEVAREAADIAARDDSSRPSWRRSATAVIFGNLRAFVFYLLSCNLSEVGVIAVATAVGAPLPLLPLQILFLNLVTDVFPALALGLGEGDASVLTQPPHRGGAALLTRRHWRAIVAYGALLTAAVLTAHQVALTRLQLGDEAANTIAFLTLALAQLWHVFNMRPEGSGLLRNPVIRNPWVWGALALCVPLVRRRFRCRDSQP